MHAYVLRGATDGKSVVLSDYRTATVWDLSSGAKLAELKQTDEDVASVAMSPNGFYVATGPGSGGEIPSHHDNAVRIWDLKAHKVVDRIDLHASEMRFSEDSSRLMISGASSSSVWIWNLKLHRFDFTYPSRYGAFSHDGKQLLTGDIRQIILWDLKTKRQLRVIECPFSRYFFESMHLSQNGKLLLAGCCDFILRTWDLETGKLTNEYVGHPTFHLGASFADHDRLVASPCLDGKVRVWETASARIVSTIDCHDQIMDQQFSSTGNACLVETRQGTMLVDIVHGKVTATLEVFQPVNDICLDPKLDQFVLQRDPLKIYSWSTGKLIKRLELRK